MFMKKNIGGPYASESDENVKAARGRQPGASTSSARTRATTSTSDSFSSR